MAKTDITNYSLNQIKRQFFNAPGKSYNFNGEHFKSAEQMYNWIQNKKKEYSQKREIVKITFDPKSTESYQKTTTETIKTKAKEEKKNNTNFTKSSTNTNKSQGSNIKVSNNSDDPYVNYKGRTTWGALFGPERVQGVNAAWSKDSHPYMDAFKSASDDVGNTVISLAMLPTMGGAAGNLYNALRTGSYGTVVGGVGGSYLGSLLGDQVTRDLSDNKYASTYDFLTKNGFNGYNAMTLDPWAWGGGYTGSYLTQGLFNGNLMSSVKNTMPRETYVEGSKEPVVQYPGERIVVERPSTRLPGNQYTGYRYSAQQTNPKGSGRGSGVRNNTHSATTPRGKTTGVSSVPITETGPLGNGKSMVVETPISEFTPYVDPTTMWWTGPVISPQEPTVPTVVPKEETRLEKIDVVSDPWEKWYGKQPEGTVQHWSGDPESAHREGWYKIHRVPGGGNVHTSRRRVGTGFEDSRGINHVVPDSTTYKISKDTNGNTRVLVGGVDPNASVSTEYLFTPEELDAARKKYLSKKKGGLLPRKRFF